MYDGVISIPVTSYPRLANSSECRPNPHARSSIFSVPFKCNCLPEETRPIGYWGMLRKEYLKNHKSGMYSYLLLTGKLDSYLADLNEQSQKQYEMVEAQMRSAEGVTEKLKAQNPIEWVRQCNNIRNRVREIVLSELVYV